MQSITRNQPMRRFLYQERMDQARMDQARMMDQVWIKDGWMSRWVGGWVDGWILDGYWMNTGLILDGYWMDGMDGWMNREMDKCTRWNSLPRKGGNHRQHGIVHNGQNISAFTYTLLIVVVLITQRKFVVFEWSKRLMSIGRYTHDWLRTKVGSWQISQLDKHISTLPTY